MSTAQADKTPDMAADADQRAALCATAKALDSKGLNRGTAGNVSRRVVDGMVITPSGMPTDRLTPGDMVYVDDTGQAHGAWRASSEWRFHHDIYRHRDDIGAIVHTHATHATAIAICGESIPAIHYMVAAAGGHEIACANYALFGTQALSDAVLAALGGNNACLMANHGMLACGPDLARALWLAEEVETLAEQYVLARRFGQPQVLDRRAMDAVKAQFAGYGQAKREAH